MNPDDFWKAKAGPDGRKIHAFDMSPDGPVGRAVCGADVLGPVSQRFSVSSPQSCGNCARLVRGKLYPSK